MTLRVAAPLSFLMLGVAASVAVAHAPQQPALSGEAATHVSVSGLQFRDLDHDGKLTPYEDWRLSPERRAADLLARMTLPEKVGMLMHGTAPSVGGSYGEGRAYDLVKARAIIGERHVVSMVTRLDGPPAELAQQNNRLQELAAATRLGIPVTISSDPRNHFQFTRGASVAAQGFSKWPEALGFGAIGDPALTKRFGEIVSREFRATGIRMMLGPQADLATEPRWPRINGTFGEDPAAVSALVGAFVEGAQGGRGGPRQDSLLTVVKHWVGYGAAAEQGFDSHNSYGRFAAFPGGRLQDHVRAFDGALAAKTAGLMPTYSILRDARIDGGAIEQVGAGYSRQLLEVALRERRHYDGVLISDFAITEDCNAACRDGAKKGEPFGVSMAWGVENLSKVDRFALGINAGLDEYGGTEEVGPLIEAVRMGKVSRARVDRSVLRILTQKFAIGEFEHPMVDPVAATQIVGNAEAKKEAHAAQARAMVLLENGAGLLPLKPASHVYLHGIDAAAVRAAGMTPVADPAGADVALVRISAPFEKLHPGFMFGSVQHEGDLDFKADNPDLAAIRALSAKVPIIAIVYLDRPAILTAIKPLVRGLIAEFGASDSAVLDVLTGRIPPAGHLPLELPSSMAAVRAQLSDVPHDSRDPLYPIGYGLRYAKR